MGDTVKNPRIELADNGFIVSYDCYTKSTDKTYDGESYQGNKQEVFKASEQQKAMDKFIELGKASGKLGSEKESDSEDKGEGYKEE